MTTPTPPRGEARLISPAGAEARTFELISSAPLRENKPANGRLAFTERAGQPALDTGNVLFDALYALAIHEARLNSVSSIKDGAYNQGAPIAIEAFQTGEHWTYVWTRDLAYSVDLGLASFDPARAVSSLLFKTSRLKAGVRGGFAHQIIQDTGSGGSYPISSDRVVWALGADTALRWLPAEQRGDFLLRAYPVLLDSLEQDRALLFDERDGLYRGEQSFLDWREQSYPEWTREHTLPIGLSKSLSTNVLHYLALRHAAAWATEHNDDDPHRRYTEWADALKDAINRAFWDDEAKLYSANLLSDGGPTVRVKRYDLLGLSLAVLSGIASPEQARSILSNYPVGPHGPSVVWPQERHVPIYHNQAIWPFVTAYWTRAGRAAGHAGVVEQGLRSLHNLAAANLSHMENFDYVSGLAHYQGPGIQGPVVNSPRQLWSVAAYFSLVQEVLFGAEASWEGLRFRPFLTPGIQQTYFAGRETIELRHLAYRGTRHRIILRLPTAKADAGSGAYAIVETRLNGRPVGDEHVALANLLPENTWEIQLGAPARERGETRLIDTSNPRAYYAPPSISWDDASGAVRVEKGKLTLNFLPSSDASLTYSVFRDGVRVAEGVRGTKWVDPELHSSTGPVRTYAVEALDPTTGLTSQLSAFRRFVAPEQQITLPADTLQSTGGERLGGLIQNWGAEQDTVQSAPFTVPTNGRYRISVRYANGSGPINTGITCAVKRLEVRRAEGGSQVAGGYAIMPQLEKWERVEDSSPLFVTLQAGERYELVLREDSQSRNMSYLDHNSRYTAWQGGGAQPYNRIHVAALHVMRVE